MKDRKLAKRYAQALFDALPDPRASEAADTFLSALARAVTASKELREALANPAVPRSAKRRVLDGIAEAQAAGKEVRSFLGVVVDHGRAAEVAAMAAAFHDVREERLGMVQATIVTAAPLPADLQKRTEAALGRLTGRKVRVTAAVDPSLIGGAVTRIGSTVYDGSLVAQLANLRRRMAGAQG